MARNLGLNGMVFSEPGGSWRQAGIGQTQAETRGLEAQETHCMQVSLRGPRAQDGEGKGMIWGRGMNGKESIPCHSSFPIRSSK